MKDSILKFILVLSLLLNVSILLSAGYTHYKQYRQITPIGYGAQESGHQVPSHLFEELSLRPEQLKTMQQKASTFHAALDGKRQEIDRKRIFLVTLMRADSPDSSAIDAVVEEINKLQQDVQKTAVTHMLEFKGMLDKDQQKKFLDLIGGTMNKQGSLQCP